MNFQIREFELLSDPVIIFFPEGGAFQIFHDSKHEGDAHIKLNESNIAISKLIDTSRSINNPRVFAVFSSKCPDRVFLLGGDVACQITFQTSEVRTFPITQGLGVSEYAYWKIFETQFGVLCIHVLGVFMLDTKLDIFWMTEKRNLDHFEKLDHTKVWFNFDHDDIWAMNLNDGTVDSHN